MSCLVIKNDGIGDLVLASGLIADIARERGPVDLVTCVTNREVAESIPGLRRVFYVSRDGLRYRGIGLRLGLRIPRIEREDRRVLRALEGERYETAICLRRFIRQSTLLLMRAVRARRRVCCWLYPTNASHSMAEDHSSGWEHFRGPEIGSELTYYRQFASEILGIQSASPPSLACTHGRSPMPVRDEVGLIIGGNSTNWPEAHWVALAQDLRARGKRLTLFGGHDSEALARRLVEAVPEARNLVGRLTLVESVEPLLSMEVVIGNDTGLTHFATLCTQRVVVILGGGTFGRFFPWPEAANQFLIFKAMECYDCDWHCKYERRHCLWDVPAGRVLEYAIGVAEGLTPRSCNLAAAACGFQPGWRRGRSGGQVEVLECDQTSPNSR